MMLFVIMLLVMAAVCLLAVSLLPPLIEKLKTWQTKKEKVMEKKLDEIFYDKGSKQIIRLYYILPVIFGGLGILLFNSLLFAFLGGICGLFVPNFILRIRQASRKQKFNHQLLDAIMILSSSLKGGLSLLQALEVLAEEIQPPMNQEIGLVLRENKMGVALEESLKHLNKRMKLEELSLVINSILVAKEAGGDLTKVFSRLSITIRDNRKLKDNISTLTMQGRMQGIIMSLLPFMFIWWVMTFNRQHFDVMLQSDTGRMLLLAALILQIIGMVLMKKFSAINI